MCSSPITELRGRGPLFTSGIAVLAALVLAACGGPDDRHVENQLPHVRLTGGPVNRVPGQNGVPLTDSVSYLTEFLWTGWDQDGIIDHYQYAIDIPDDLLDERDDPGPTGIAWKDTTVFRARFLFRTPEQDSILQPDGTYYEPERYRGDHTFYVRAVDNDGAASEAAYVTFTARTATPQTRITVPGALKEAQVLFVGRRVNLAWEGIDPDSPDPRKRPAYYEWKLIEVENVIKMIGLPVLTYWVTDPAGPGEARAEDGTPKFPWHRVGVDTTHLTLLLDTTSPGHDYILAIRAVDEAGGVESRFITGQNAALLSASERYTGTPVLTVRERLAGSFTFSGEPVWEIETAVGQCLRFEFRADASAYGGEIQCYNYGIDVVDAEQDGPSSGFRGCSLLPYTYEPVCFRFPGVHTLTVKARDTGGGTSIATVIIKVVDFPRDREVLYVDDFMDRGSLWSNDARMDAKVIDMLTSIGFSNADNPEIYQVDAFGPDDISPAPALLKLSQLARYKYIVWSVHGVSFDGHTALVAANACDNGRILQAYVGAGGAVWIFGQRVFGQFRRYNGTGASDCVATVRYDENSEGLTFLEGMFVYDFLHITEGGIFRYAGKSTTNGLVRAAPTREAAAAAVPFPPVEIDSTAFNLALRGIPFYDAMFQPSVDHTGGLDTVYTVSATAASTTTGQFLKRPIGLRYADPDRISPEQGPVAVFGFPIHFLKQGEVHPIAGTDDFAGTGVKGMAAAVFAWFRQNGPPAASPP